MKHFQEAASEIIRSATLASNEEQFKVEAERILRILCLERGIHWNPYTLEHSFLSGSRRLDVVHGATLIEYEPPRSFNRIENHQLRHAQLQAEEYTRLLADEEGRDLLEYTVVAWDGLSISFGVFEENSIVWEPLQEFDANTLLRLVTSIEQGGLPLVSPLLLRQFVGPDTEVGGLLIPKLFSAIVSAVESESMTRTKLIYSEWSRLFGQVDGVESGRLSEYLRASSVRHGVSYHNNPQAYVFALSTYIAVVAKISAAFALLTRDSIAVNFGLDTHEFLVNLEEGDYFQQRGIRNMLSTDFFSWYLGSDVDASVFEGFGSLLERLRNINFDVSKKSPSSVRDLFKGLYMEFTPPALRHALGEYYTPDWLASHVINTVKWSVGQSMLDIILQSLIQFNGCVDSLPLAG